MPETEMRSASSFSFSPAALAQIERIRSEYVAHSPNDPPAVAGLSFGWSGKLTDTDPTLRPTVGFWRKSEFPSSAGRLVEVISGIEIVVWVKGEDRDRLRGKVVDYHQDRAFFLRAP
jgi:hypothetical protein